MLPGKHKAFGIFIDTRIDCNHARPDIEWPEISSLYLEPFSLSSAVLLHY